MKCLLDESRGIHIPKKFIENYDPTLWGLTEDDDENISTLLSGPDHIEYWEAWQEVLDRAKYIDGDGVEWHLFQDGDLFAIKAENH